MADYENLIYLNPRPSQGSRQPQPAHARRAACKRMRGRHQNTGNPKRNVYSGLPVAELVQKALDQMLWLLGGGRNMHPEGATGSGRYGLMVQKHDIAKYCETSTIIDTKGFPIIEIIS